MRLAKNNPLNDPSLGKPLTSIVRDNMDWNATGNLSGVAVFNVYQVGGKYETVSIGGHVAAGVLRQSEPVASQLHTPQQLGKWLAALMDTSTAECDAKYAQLGKSAGRALVEDIQDPVVRASFAKTRIQEYIFNEEVTKSTCEWLEENGIKVDPAWLKMPKDVEKALKAAEIGID